MTNDAEVILGNLVVLAFPGGHYKLASAYATRGWTLVRFRDFLDGGWRACGSRGGRNRGIADPA